MTDGNGRGNSRSKGKGRGPVKFSPEERKARRVELAQRDDAEVITRRAAETNDFIRLLSANDYIVNRLRNNLGRRNGVPAAAAIAFLERNEQLRQEMNLLNAEMCKAMGIDYTPPRGYDNPLEAQKDKGEKGAGKKKDKIEQAEQAQATTT
jgi:hypothetical protein